MRTSLVLLAILLFGSSALFAQVDTPDKPDAEFVFKPTLGLGAGMFTFYGDISKGQPGNSPIVSRVGYDLRVTQAINPFLDLSFYVLFGTLGANERSITRNLNFESNISTGGMNIAYNFDHFLKPDRAVEPYVSLGIESFEFLSKIDLEDAYGNTYHYWKDGSIRNMSEDDVNADDAVRIYRDYFYESDIREENADDFGKYPERSFAMPVGFGANMHVTDKVSFRIGSSYHLTFTDLIDGVTAESTDNRVGDASNDKFLFTSFNLNYNLVGEKGEFKNINSPEGFGADSIFEGILTDDEDNDGIIDFEDLCPGTPSEAMVDRKDRKGCPLDSDKDGIPDYLDDEMASVDSAFVDKEGVTISDDIFLARYEAYMDSIGQDPIVRHADHQSMVVMLRIGTMFAPIPANMVRAYLAMDVKKDISREDTLIVQVRDFAAVSDELKARITYDDAGFPVGFDGVVSYTGRAFVDPEVASATVNPDFSKDVDEMSPDPIKMEDVDLGPQYPDSTNLANPDEKNNPDIIDPLPVHIKTNPDVTPDPTPDPDVTPDPTPDPDVTPDPTPDPDVTPDPTPDPDVTPDPTPDPDATPDPTPDPVVVSDPSGPVVAHASAKADFTTYRVQVSALSKPVATHIYDKVPELVVIEKDGLYKYYSGAFPNFNEAAKRRIDVIASGFTGAYVVTFKGERGKETPLSEDKTIKTVDNIDINKPASDIQPNSSTTRYVIQLGIYKDDVPVDMVEKFMTLGNVEERRSPEGLARFVYGNFPNYTSARAACDDLLSKGYNDAFIAGEFEGRIIPAGELKLILGK